MKMNRPILPILPQLLAFKQENKLNLTCIYLFISAEFVITFTLSSSIKFQISLKSL